MVEYGFKFKCRMCRETYYNPRGGLEPMRYGLPDAVIGILYPRNFIGLPPKIFDIHHCKKWGVRSCRLNGI